VVKSGRFPYRISGTLTLEGGFEIPFQPVGEVALPGQDASERARTLARTASIMRLRAPVNIAVAAVAGFALTGATPAPKPSAAPSPPDAIAEVLRYLEATYVKPVDLGAIATAALEHTLPACPALVLRQGAGERVVVRASSGRVVVRLHDATTAGDVAARLARVTRRVKKLCPAEAPGWSERLVQALVGALGDPFSAYYSAAGYRQVLAASIGESADVGLTFDRGADGTLVVAAVRRGSSAQRAGLRPGDRLSHIGGEAVRDQATAAAMLRLLGPPGTSVEVTLAGGDGGPGRRVALTRQRRGVPRVDARRLTARVGYLMVEAFDGGTGQRAIDALEHLNATNPVQGLVLDLRGNPGGLLDEGVTLLRALMPKGRLVSVADRQRQEAEVHRADQAGPFSGLALAVLVDRGTASVAEALALVLKEQRRALLVGERTYGKGSVQQVLELEAGGALGLTVARYVSPGGVTVDRGGLTPDRIVDPAGDGPLGEAAGYLAFEAIPARGAAPGSGR
jgi:carboxyl-terminal processing protease